MNMILDDYVIAEIKQGNTLANPLFTEGDTLKTFAYVVANPPFSDKRRSIGLDAEYDPYHRFAPYGVPLARQGDYAYLLHILRSRASSACRPICSTAPVTFRLASPPAISMHWRATVRSSPRCATPYFESAGRTSYRRFEVGIAEIRRLFPVAP